MQAATRKEAVGRGGLVAQADARLKWHERLVVDPKVERRHAGGEGGLLVQTALVAHVGLDHGPLGLRVPLLAPGGQDSGNAVKLAHGILVVQHVEVDVDSRLQRAAGAQLLVVGEESVNFILFKRVVEHGVVGGDDPAELAAAEVADFALQLGVDRADHGRRSRYARLDVGGFVDRFAVVDSAHKHVAAKVLVAVGRTVALKSRGVGLLADQDVDVAHAKHAPGSNFASVFLRKRQAKRPVLVAGNGVGSEVDVERLKEAER